MAGMSVTSDGRSRGLQDFVTRRLAGAIVSGELPPGARLSPARIAEDLGVSHIPVREALAGLEAAGQVTRIPRVGFFVSELSTQDIVDVYHWRRVLEDEAHRLGVPKLVDADLTRMRELNEETRAAVAAGDLAALLDAHRRFHFIPFERAGSVHLTRFISHLWDAAARYQGLLTVDRLPAHLHDHHDVLMAAFEARDVGAVNGLMAKHRALTLDAIRATRFGAG